MITIRKLGQHLNLILAVILLLAGSVFGQTRQEYTVSDFRGGLNLATDSIDQAPNEAIQADNTTLDKFGALHKRYGVIFWNDSLISADTILDIHYVEDKNGDKTLFIATNNYIYDLDGWQDTITSSTWAGYEIDYEIGKIDAPGGTKYIYGDTSAGDDMAWIPVADIGDVVIVGTDTLVIDSILADTLLHVTTNSSAHSDASYRLLKFIKGVPRLISSDGNLFVADSRAEPWWYDGTTPQLLGIIDEGTVTDAPITDSTIVVFDSGTVQLQKGRDIVYIRGVDIANDAAFFDGNVLHATYSVNRVHGSKLYKFSGTIVNRAILTSDSVLYLNRVVRWTNPSSTITSDIPDIVILPDTSDDLSERRWWIEPKNMRLTTRQYKYLEDTSQIWSPDDYQGFWVINGNNAMNRGYITKNTQDRILYNAPSTFAGGMIITPTSANDSYTYTDTLCLVGAGICDVSPTTWTSPGSGTDIAMVCDSMVKYLNDDSFWIAAGFTATDLTTSYSVSGLPGVTFTVAPDTAQDTSRTASASGINFSTGDKYYVAWQTPSMISKIFNREWSQYNLDSVFVNKIFFSQIYFHRNRLYAIGKEISRHNVEYDRWNIYAEGDTSSTARVWFADLGRPGYIPTDYNLDVTGADLSGENLSIYSHDATQSLFGLRDDLYVTTNSNIYRISGEPAPGPEDLYLSQVIRGIGTTQPRGIVTTKDNVAYIMNSQGIWHFDGNVITKISYNVDPLVERYRGSRMVAGKFKDDLFFSYPDSNKTLLFFDPLKKFVGPWEIGMLVINDQFVGIDSNYFLFVQSEDSAYVLKYPRDFVNFSDILEPNDTSVVVFRYRPGWLTLGTLRDKVLEDIEITAFTINPVSGYDFLNYLAVYRDFTDTVRWSATAFSEGTPINAFESIGDDGAIHGRAYQILVKDSTDNDFWLSNWLARWYDPTR